MLRLGLFLLVTLMLQSTWCTSDEIQDDEESEVPRSHEVVDSFSRNYNNAVQYPWRQWNFPYYQPRIPQSPTGENSPPLADPRFVTNRCNSWQSYTTTTTYPCYTTVYTTTITYVTSTTVTTTIYPTTPYPTTTPTTPYTETTTTGYPSTTTAPPIDAITTCGVTVTHNNTFWQSPSTAVSAPSTCALTVRMDSNLVEQSAKPICQIRLDFVSFTIAGPSTAAATAGTCTDTFTVGGASTVAPIICGVNTGQHMYLDVPSSGTSPTDVQLMFNFAAGAATRSWNIKIAMLPCGASYLAPSGCLQYFSASSGRVKSFNWQDSASAQQLNNQNYKICFRTELVSGSRATQMCVTTCTTTTANVGFLLTGAAAGTAAVGTVAATGCTYDFLAIAGGFDSFTGVINDRYCGGILASTTTATTGSTICTKISPFRMTFGTDGTEAAITAVVTPAQPVLQNFDTANTGFCLNYQEQ